MTEEFLHYIWQYKLFALNSTLESGETFVVLNSGEKNTDSGPDFFNARIRIGETTWAGNVEIHLYSTDWYRHNHETDKNYDNIILHVVWKNDQSIVRTDGNLIPVLELEGKIFESAWKTYLQFMASKTWIPCQRYLHDLEPVIITSWLDRLLLERFERKTQAAASILDRYNNDWNQAFYHMLAVNMGFKINSDVFALLASSLPFPYLLKHADNLFQLEAIVFGQAGLLDGSFSEGYPNDLQKEYRFLQAKFSLQPIDGHLWRFMRLHPANFPTVRLAQFASIIHYSNGLFSQVIENMNTEYLIDLLSSAPSAYWENHYIFDKVSPKLVKRPGKDAAHSLLINLVAPFIFVFGSQTFSEEHKRYSITLLESLPPEKNSVISMWKSLGIDALSGAQSQALLELKNNYCNFKKCLSCRFGNTLLRRSIRDDPGQLF
jgi:hypothetical protein